MHKWIFIFIAVAVFVADLLVPRGTQCQLAIAPAVGGALISAGVGLLQGLFGGWAAKAEANRQKKFEAQTQAFNTQRQGARDLGQNQGSAMSQLMADYKDALT